MRITIYVPDELGEAVRRVRQGGATLNVSAVCQRRLRHEVAKRRGAAVQALLAEHADRRRASARAALEAAG